MLLARFMFIFVALTAMACRANSTTVVAEPAQSSDASADAAGVAAVDSVAASDAPPAAPEVVVTNKALVFVHDPVTDQKITTEVVLDAPSSADGKLTGAFVDVRNCLPEAGGVPLKRSGFTIGNLCHEVQTVMPTSDGNYLHIAPPSEFNDPSDGFAEVMMYYHVNRMHSYFKDKFGLDSLDFPLYALVNVTINVPLAGGWQGFPNAAFMPKEAFVQFNLPPRDNGAIVFGQYQQTDFSYDASVIYHEYTHAMIGTTRLGGVLIDSYGLDNLPGAMNEGFADYFSSSVRDSPLIGTYALTFGGEHAKRDLSQVRKCPDDLFSEVHADGKIIGSTMWSLRQILGADIADGIILTALQQFSQQTNLEVASKLIYNEAKKVSPEAGATTKEVLTNHGMLGCVRAKKLVDFAVQTSENKVPYAIEGKADMGPNLKLPDGVPGYVQFWLNAPTDAKAVQIRWKAEAAAGFGGFGGGAPPEVSLALRKGQPAQLSLMDGGAVVADAKVKGTSDGKGAMVATLTGNCLHPNGKLFIMFLNNGGKGGITELSSKVLAATDGEIGVQTCTKGP